VFPGAQSSIRYGSDQDLIRGDGYKNRTTSGRAGEGGGFGPGGNEPGMPPGGAIKAKRAR